MSLKKERYFGFDPYFRKYYCKKCDRNHWVKNRIGMNHMKFGIDPFLGYHVVSLKKEGKNNG